MRLQGRFTQAVIVMLMVQIGIAYSSGTTPVFALIGIIIATCSILARQFIRKKA